MTQGFNDRSDDSVIIFGGTTLAFDFGVRMICSSAF